jgi:hypothetical protein
MTHTEGVTFTSDRWSAELTASRKGITTMAKDIKSGAANKGTTGTATGATSTATTDKKKRTGGVDKRVAYPYLKVKGADGKEVDAAFEAVPADFDPKKHKPIPRKYFASEAVFYTLRAEALEKQAARFRELAKTAGTVGNVKDKKSAKKLVNMQKRFNELQASLAAQGVDVAALLAAVASQTAPATPAEGEKPAEGEAAKS